MPARSKKLAPQDATDFKSRGRSEWLASTGFQAACAGIVRLFGGRMTKPLPGRQPKRAYSKHGLTALKNSVRLLGNRTLDQRTHVAKALTHWRAELVRDLGGPETISKQQAVVIELAVKTHLLLQSIDNWLLQQKSLINFRKKSVLPLVRERQVLADSLARYMTLLGMERKTKPVPALSEYLTKKYGEKDSNSPG